MKNLKWLVPLAVVVVLLMVALPVAADDPFGGPPSKTSGNGTTTWGAVYIGGTWDNTLDSNVVYKNPDTFSLATGNVSTAEYNKYVTNWSAKVTIPGGGSSRWFKFDTVKSRDVEVYLDDVPKWGAAYRYFGVKGCGYHQNGERTNSGVGDCDKSDNLLRLGIDTSELSKRSLITEYNFSYEESMFLNGFAGRLYPPETIASPNYFWPVPNNSLLTTRSGTGPRVAFTQGSYGGYNRGGCTLLCDQTHPAGGAIGQNNYGWMEPADQVKWGDGNTHLLAIKLHQDGWIYIRVFNWMIWDNDMQMGTRFTPNSKYDFPCSNCPYPFNPNQ